MIARALVEVLCGTRSCTQLRPHCASAVYQAICDIPIIGRGGRIISQYICEPTPGIAETSNVIWAGGRTRAMALRLQASDDRWVITALQLA